EFAGISLTGPRRMERSENLRRHQQPAMTRQLDQILAGITIGGAKDSENGLVERPAVRRGQRAERSRSVRQARKLAGRHALNRLDRSGPGNPDHGERRATWRCGEGSDDVGQHALTRALIPISSLAGIWDLPAAAWGSGAGARARVATAAAGSRRSSRCNRD